MSRELEKMVGEMIPGARMPMSEEMVENLYSFAHGFYSNGKYKEAVDVFRFLIALRVRSHRFWKGLGASLQMTGAYREAVDAYSWAALLDPNDNDPAPHFHAAECLCSLNQTQRALQALKSAAFLAKKEKKHHDMLPRINALGRVWKQKEVK